MLLELAVCQHPQLVASLPPLDLFHVGGQFVFQRHVLHVLQAAVADLAKTHGQTVHLVVPLQLEQNAGVSDRGSKRMSLVEVLSRDAAEESPEAFSTISLVAGEGLWDHFDLSCVSIEGEGSMGALFGPVVAVRPLIVSDRESVQRAFYAIQPERK